MLPYIYIGEFSISTYSLMLFAGAVGMFICLWLRRKNFSLSSIACFLFTLLLTVVGVIGAKLLFILEHPQDIAQNAFSMGGVSFFGSVFLIPLLMPFFGRSFGLPRGQTADICGPCVAVMIGCMRMGCFLAGCCGGWQFCVGNICFVWPTQLLESVGDFGILSILLYLEKQKKQPGTLYPVFMIMYSAMRFFIEFLRDTPKNWIYFSHGQWFSLLAIIVGFFWLASNNYPQQKGD